MKYLHYILQNMVPEWVKLYLNYKLLKTYLSISSQLKKMLVLAKKMRTLTQYREIKKSIVLTFVLMDKLQHDNKCFIDLFAEETAKVEAFINWKHGDLKMKMSKLQAQVKSMRLTKEDLETRFARWKIQLRKKQSHSAVEIDSPEQELIDYDRIEKDYDDLKVNKKELLETFYRFYHETVHFQSFVEVNHEAIRKILKKYRKQMIKGIRQKKDEKESFGKVIERMQLSNVSVKVKSLIIDIEQLMIQNFYSSKPNLCKENLRKYSEIVSVRKNILFWFGFFSGITFVFIIILITLRLKGSLNRSESIEQVFPIFRGAGLFLLYFWFLALDVFGWNYFRVNYKIYLGFNHHFSTLPEVLERVMILSTIYLLSLLFYCTQIQENGFFFQISSLTPNIFPILPWVALGFFVIMPTKRALNGEGKQWMRRMLWGSFLGHFIKYESRYTFCSEQLISMIIPFMDLEYTVCYYYNLNRADQGNCYLQERQTAMLLCVVIYFVLCCQYITRAREKGKFFKTNEMWNFIKNLLAMQLGILSFIALKVAIFRWVWLVFAVGSACFQYFWDICMDWHFFEPGARYKFLRNDLGYNKPCIYYAMVIANIFLRVVWTVNVSPNITFAFNVSHVQVLLSVVGVLELTRRLLSNFLKIEKEHITNQKLFKTVMDYKYPFDLDSQVKIQEYDDEDNKNTHWSISTIQHQIEMSQGSSTTRRLNPIRRRSEFLVGDHLNEPLMNDEESKKMDSSIQFGGVQTKPESLQEQINNKTISDDRREQFQLTQVVQKKSEQMFLSKKRSEEQPQNEIWDILNKANSQEAFQQQKTSQIQEDNKKYKDLISDLYDKFQLSQK